MLTISGIRENSDYIINKLDGKFANRVDSFIWHPRVVVKV